MTWVFRFARKFFMNENLTVKVNELFSMVYSDAWGSFEGNIIDDGSVSISYTTSQHSGHIEFTCSKPLIMRDFIIRADDPTNAFGRPDIKNEMDDNIVPLSLTITPVNPKYFEDTDDVFFSETTNTNASRYLEPILFQFYHPDSESDLWLGGLTSSDILSGKKAFKGPTLNQFLVAIESLEKWSDLDFSQFIDRRSLSPISTAHSRFIL